MHGLEPVPLHSGILPRELVNVDELHDVGDKGGFVRH